MRPTLLCYNLKGSEKGRKIAMIFSFLKYKVRHVERAEYLRPVGVLAGVRKEEEEYPEYDGEGFLDEMLVICTDTESQLDKALFLMRKEKLTVPLKAMLTPSNQGWTSLELHGEIHREHLYMKEKDEERKQKD